MNNRAIIGSLLIAAAALSGCSSPGSCGYGAGSVDEARWFVMLAGSDRTRK